MSYHIIIANRCGLGCVNCGACKCGNCGEYVCEVCHKRDADRFNETVRDKQTKVAKILTICNHCFEKITGAK
jgi:hypothetical protein